jgi:hypothetical protein
MRLGAPQDRAERLHEIKDGEFMEKVAYELRPFLYFLGSTYALLLSPGSILMASSGWILLGCSLYIFNVRTHYRRALRQMRERRIIPSGSDTKKAA